MVIKIVPNDRGNPPGKLADAELHFTEGELEGLKLLGLRGVGAAQRHRPQRHVSREGLRGQRRTALVCAVASAVGSADPRPHPGSHPAGVRRHAGTGRGRKLTRADAAETAAAVRALTPDPPHGSAARAGSVTTARAAVVRSRGRAWVAASIRRARSSRARRGRTRLSCRRR